MVHSLYEYRLQPEDSFIRFAPVNNIGRLKVGKMLDQEAKLQRRPCAENACTDDVNFALWQWIIAELQRQ